VRRQLLRMKGKRIFTGEIVRCFPKPSTDSMDGGASIERRIDFDRIEMFRV